MKSNLYIVFYDSAFCSGCEPVNAKNKTIARGKFKKKFPKRGVICINKSSEFEAT